MKIGVILPVEERFDPVEGGAIARWVASVYPHLPYETTIFAAPPLKGEGYPLALWKSRRTKQLDTLATAAASGLSRLFKRNPVAIRAKLMSNGKLWVAQLTKHLHDFDILHIHNRPTYVQWIRQSGYKGHIILHMHNSLDIRRPDHAPDAVACADQVLFCSEFLRTQAATAYGGRLPPNRVVLNGIETTSSDAVRDAREPYLLVTAGRLVPEKGAMEAIKIALELDGAGLPVTLKIIGSSFFGSGFKSPFVQELERAVEEAKTLTGRAIVEMTGQLSHPELVKAMHSAKLFLFPCQWEEPFGMVIAEAMACGTPPVASRRGGIPEVLGEALSDELLVEATNIANFVSKCSALIEDDKKWAALSESSFNRAVTRFSWQSISSSFQGIVNKEIEPR